MAVDFFLKVDGIEGESKDSKHQNEIDVLELELGGPQLRLDVDRRRWRFGCRQHAGLQFHDDNQQGDPEADAGMRDRRSHQDRES